MALFLILAPFATFATLMMLTTVKISLAASAVVAFGLVARDMVAGRSIKMLTTGALVLFASLAGYHLMAATEMSPTSVRLAVDGKVLDAAIDPSASDITLPELEKCMASAVKSLSFPPSKRGKESVVRYPFDFKPGSKR